MCVYTGGKNQICFWQEPFDGIWKKKKEEIFNIGQALLIYEFKIFVFIFLSIGTW